MRDSSMIVVPPSGRAQRFELPSIAGCSRAWCDERFEAVLASVLRTMKRLPEHVTLHLRRSTARKADVSGEAYTVGKGLGVVTVYDTGVCTPASIVTTMLHEAVHLGGPRGHGTAFRRSYVRAAYAFTLADPLADPEIEQVLVGMYDDDAATALDEVICVAVSLFLQGGRLAPFSLLDLTSGFGYAVRLMGLRPAWKLARGLAAWRWSTR